MRKFIYERIQTAIVTILIAAFTAVLTLVVPLTNSALPLAFFECPVKYLNKFEM